MIARMPAKTEKPYERRPGVWYGRIDLHNGTRKRRKLCVGTYEDAVDRLRVMQKREDLIRDGVVSADQYDYSDAGDRLIAELLDEYTEELSGSKRSANHVRECRRWVEKYADASRVKKLKHVTTGNIERYLSGLLSRGLAVESRNAAATRIKSFLSWCVDRKMLAKNPAGSIKRVRSEGGTDRPRALTQAELMALIDHTPDKLRKLAYLLGARVGLRVNEAYRLRRQHVAEDGRWLRLTAAVTKEGRACDLPLHADVRALLAGMKIARHGPICGKMPSRYTWLRDLARAGIVKKADPDLACGNWSESDLVGYRDDRGRVLSRRCLRHTYGTHLAASGATPQAIAKLMRHTDPALTLQYYTDPRLLDLEGVVSDLASVNLVPIEHQTLPENAPKCVNG